jgi:hypothetical protein
MTRAARGGRQAASRRPGRLLTRGCYGRAGGPRTTLRVVVLPLLVVPVLLGAGTTAYAYWTAAGSGAGQVGVQTALALSLTGTSVVAGELHPGATRDLGFSLANPNSWAVRLTTLTAATVASSDEAGCPSARYLLLPETVKAAFATNGYELTSPILVPAGSLAVTGSVPSLVTLSAAAPSACQGVTFTVTLALTGSQA